MISAKFAGLASLASTLNTFRKAVKAASTKRSKDIAEQMVEDMKARVPADSGELRDSIRAEEGENGAYVVLAGGTPETARTTKAGRSYDEARLVEFGTVNQPARPFFRPVLEEARQKYGDEVLEVNGDSQ